MGVGVDDTHTGVCRGVWGGLDIKRSEEIDVVRCCERIPAAQTHRRHSKTRMSTPSTMPTPLSPPTYPPFSYTVAIP